MDAGLIDSAEYNRRGEYYKEIIYYSENEIQQANLQKLDNELI